MDLYEESSKILEENGIQYSNMISYHKMCRWNSGMFYKHPALADMQFYWRVEPKVRFFCDVDYDVFRYMQDHNKTYGFTINLYDAPESMPTLWPETVKFLEAHPEYLHENNAMDWLRDDQRRPEHNKKANGYSTCHFWSNFEIADMSFWRSKPYEAYFDYLDRSGGFFYERWGDAPVHSIGLGLFEDKNKIHWYVKLKRLVLAIFFKKREKLISVFACAPGFEISVINTSLTSIARIRINARAVNPESFSPERTSSGSRTVDRIGLNTSERADAFISRPMHGR